MAQFDLRKFLAENKLHEAMFDVKTTEKIAQQVADAFTAEDSNDLDLKYVVSPGVEAGHFDLDVEAGPNTPGEDWKDENGFSIDNYLGQYAGGSFLIKNGIVINAAMRSAPVAKVSPEGEIEMISAEESRAAIGMDDEIDMKNMEENKMLEEGIIDAIKDKIVSVGKKLLGKFSPEEQASMKAAAEKVLGPNYSKEDITIDKAKEIGKIISGGLDESQELDENLRKKIGNALAGLGMSTAFVAGHGFGDTDAGAITAGIGVLAAVIGMLMANIEEVKENKPSNKMKKSELKEMIKAAMLEDARTDAEQEGYKDGFEDAKDDIEDKLKDMKVSEAEDVDVEDNENIDVEDTEDIDVDVEKDVKVDDEETEADIDVKTSVAGESEDVEAVQGLLTKALEMSQALGDEKLEDQIGNTITYFTRAHVSKLSEMDDMDVNVNTTEMEAELGLEEVQSLNEVKRLQKLAGIIK